MYEALAQEIFSPKYADDTVFTTKAKMWPERSRFFNFQWSIEQKQWSFRDSGANWYYFIIFTIYLFYYLLLFISWKLIILYRPTWYQRNRMRPLMILCTVCGYTLYLRMQSGEIAQVMCIEPESYRLNRNNKIHCAHTGCWVILALQILD